MADEHGLHGGVKFPSVKLKRHFERAHTDSATRDSILDEALVGHLAVVLDGFPAVIPTTYARVGEVLFIHGSSKNRAMRMAVGNPACFEVTILDGLVYAASAFNHSMNYRSVVVYGIPELIEGEAQKSSGCDEPGVRSIMEAGTGSAERLRRVVLRCRSWRQTPGSSLDQAR